MRHITLRRVLGFVSALALTGLAGTVSTAQTAPPQDPQQPPRFRTESNFVRIDAYPLKDGKPMLGLTAADFEVFEDGTAQKIETFEHVLMQPAGPDGRPDVGSQRASLQAVANPRNRVFVIFLDVPHVSVAAAHTINEPLIRLMDRILGPDDLVAVMTPEMAASQIVFGRKTQVIEDSLRKNWPWGTRFSLTRDTRENAYLACYPPMTGEGAESALAKEMIRRKRERATLDSLVDLVGYLRTIREERKAIITITEGWVLMGPNRNVMTLREDKATGYKEAPPRLDPVGVGLTGKLTTRDERQAMGGSMNKGECDADRMMLADMDNPRYFREVVLQSANRANASFYPVDPRGLPVFDNPIGPEPPPTIMADLDMLKERLDTLRTLANNTDGLAVLDNNDLDRGLRRISDDLNSYYLLGYYSTNTKLDGRYRTVKVRVKQPGVEVRARNGYRAATEAEVMAARRAADAPVPEAKATASAAISRLDRVRADTRFVINAAPGVNGRLWIAGELYSVPGRPDEFAKGGTATIEATVGGSSTNAKVTLKPGERAFLTSIDLSAAAAGGLDIRARFTPEGAVLPVTDSVRLDSATSGIQPLLFRRGPTTGNRLQPSADFRFSRTERMRLEIAAPPDLKGGGGRLLDRGGQPLQVPVTVSERTDEAGNRWISADVTLAPLAPGDYAIEITLLGPSEQRIVTGIRIAR